MAGWIDKRPGQPKPWLGRYRPPGGKTRSKAFALQREAKDWVAEQRSEHEAAYADPKAGHETFDVYAGKWLARQTVKQSTRDKYGSYINSQMRPLRGRPLKALTADELETWIHGLDYAAATVRTAVNLAGAIFDDAVDRGRLTRSPMPSKKRRQKVLPRAPRPSNPRTRFLTETEVQRLADSIDPAYRAMVLVGAYAGLRWGEAAGLAPADINVKKRLLRVHHTLAQPRKTSPYRDPEMKTDAARRTIALGGLAGVLADHLEKYATTEWVFPTKQGEPLRASNWRRRYWHPATEKAGLTPLRFHDLRHTHASLLIHQGESVLVVQKRLGHSNPSVTLNIYGHLFPGADEAAADRLTADL